MEHLPNKISGGLQEPFSEISEHTNSSNAFGSYSDAAYVAGEMRNLTKIILTHAQHLVTAIEEDSPEHKYFEKRYGIHLKTAHKDDSIVGTTGLEPKIERAPVTGTLMHTFNAASVGAHSPSPVVDQETAKNLRALDKISSVARGVTSGNYQEFSQILDALSPTWREEAKDIGLRHNHDFDQKALGGPQQETREEKVIFPVGEPDTVHPHPDNEDDGYILA